jgi:hypothetical protein
MAKAFDTLSHDFVDLTYKFFNLGPVIRRWLNLLGNNRTACINFNKDCSSPHFQLGRGRPQGDNISPNTFNFSDQILIFKIELDPQVLPVPRAAPVIINNNNEFFRLEANRNTCKNESLADDNTTLTICDRGSLTRIKKILTDFGDISGLRCNFDKSCIMTTNVPRPEDTDLIQEIGFRCVDTFKLLGTDICRNLNNVDNIFENIRTKFS